MTDRRDLEADIKSVASQVGDTYDEHDHNEHEDPTLDPANSSADAAEVVAQEALEKRTAPTISLREISEGMIKQAANRIDPRSGQVHARAAFANKGPSFRMVNADELGEWGVTILLYGKAGSGKTTTMAIGAADSPHGAPVFMADAEGGARAVEGRKDIRVGQLESWDHLMEFRDWVRGDPTFPYKTILLDNLSEYVTLARKKLGGATGAMDQRKWQDLTNMMLTLVRDFRQIAQERRINVFFIAWDLTTKDDSGLESKMLAFNPALQERLPGIVDIIGYLSVDPDGVTRSISFKPSPRTQSKFRVSMTEIGRSIPPVIKFKEGQNVMADLLAALKGGVRFPAEKYRGSAPKQSENG